jgi:AcrR family transcriptional regulator
MRKTSRNRIEAKIRKTQVLDLRREGFTLREIAASLNVSVGTVHSDILAALNALREQERFSTEEWVTLELERLDMATRAIAPQVEKGSFKAIDRWLRIMDRRAKLLGLYKSPQKDIDVLSALKVLVDNGILPPEIVSLAGEELGDATDTISEALSGRIDDP